ncbi:MAG: uroporphyrinogen decarboxylase family protein [Kiritimatiellae bacterium]|nr:uroporphyrinogen decarboxylase family protein [Kiritimatiellia bacterium]
MTQRERMQAVLRGQRPDAMAWCGDMTYWHASHEQIGDIPERWRGKAGRHRMHQELGLSEYVPGCTGGDVIEGTDVRHESLRTGALWVNRWHTPVGTIQETLEYCPGSFSWGYTEHAVKGPADLRVVRYIYEHRRFVPAPDRYTNEDREYAAYGLGPTHVGAQPTPISELNKHWIGVMELTYMLMDQPEEMRLTLDAIGKLHDDIYRNLADAPPSCVMINENLSATTMGGYFDDFIAPYVRRWTGWLRAGGHISMLHNDGTLRGTLEKLGAAGVDCIDSVVPKPVGDVEIADLRRLAGNDVILIGGLPGAIFAPPFTARDIERQVREIIRCHKETNRFIFGVADQVPPNGDLALVRLVGELIEKYGRM